MTSPGSALAAWPALAGGHVPPRISYERGVWGKLPGSRADFKWIAATSYFSRQARSLERELHLGSEDTPRTATHWRSLGEVSFAVVCYPSKSTDASGRTSFLEKQVFAWRRPDDVPAVVGALALLPQAALADASVWSSRHTQSWGGEDDSALVLPLDSHAPLQISSETLAAALASGLDELGRTVREEALADFYAHLLAGHRAVPLAGLQAPLGPAALAALLLPLPRAVADTLSIAGWLPSQRISDPAELQRCWNAALAGSAPPLTLAVPAPEHQERGRVLARALLARDPAALAPRPARTASVQGGRRQIQIAMWGPASAGKTVLLVQLYLADHEEDWEVIPSEASQKFFDDMRERLLLKRSFPAATQVAGEQIELRFRHRRTRDEVILRLKDQAGEETLDLTGPIRENLAGADGLLLLFDPEAQGDRLRSRLWRALEFEERREKDLRPIAVCLSKVDLLIRTLDDLRSARGEDAGGFVRRHDKMDLTKLLDRFCDNYRLFPVSAAGLRTQYGTVESVVFYDEALNPRLAPGGTPLNVMAPFTWLLDQVVSRP